MIKQMRPEISDKSTQLTVRLAPEIMEKLWQVSARIGVKPAQLATMAIGDYVTRTEANYNAAASMQALVVKEVFDLFRSEEFNNQVNESAENFIKEMKIRS